MSCGRTNRLSEDDYNWMPYIGNETLVFRSHTGEMDTIFLDGRDTMLAYYDPLSLNTVKYEIISVSCKHTDATSDGYRYLQNHFFQIEKNEDKKATLNSRLTTKDARFYRLRQPIRIDSLNKEKPSVFTTAYNHYNDVFIIKAEANSVYSERDNFVTKIYWSKSNGLIRYDKKDSVYWELVKIKK